MPTPSSAPIDLAHCGEAMEDVTNELDREMGCWTLRCVQCGWLVRIAEEPDPPIVPASQTCHPPGSEGKMGVMMERFRCGEMLFHPRDVRDGVDVPPRDDGPTIARAERLPRGVSWDEKRQCYRARVTLPGRGQVYLGLYDTVEDAREAIRAAKGRQPH